MIEYLYLGRVEYAEALRLQAQLVELRTSGRIGNALLLLEHPPVLTLGRNASRANILATDEVLARGGVTLHEINRGGDVTYHGPGQLIGYPIFDLRSLRNSKGGRLGPVDFVRLMEEALMRLCGEFGVRAERICGLTGVWCHLPWRSLTDGSPSDQSCERKATDHPAGERKIAAIGIHVSRGVTSHGFAFNVTTDLKDFELIIPCGIMDRAVTSLERELEREGTAGTALPDLEAMANRAARQFGFVFGEQVLAVESLDALLERARDAAGNAAQEFPTEDTPLQIPPEIARLRGEKSRPVSA